jgi:hypothetical protein
VVYVETLTQYSRAQTGEIHEEEPFTRDTCKTMGLRLFHTNIQQSYGGA